MTDNTSQAPGSPCLVMGIGNYLMGDEGLGCHFIQRFKDTFPEDIEVVDGGTGGFLLMPYFEEHAKVILIDATMDADPPGTIKMLKPRFSKDFPKSMSTHDIGLKDVVEAMTIRETMPEIFLFTVSIEEIQPMEVNLSPRIDEALSELKSKIDGLIRTF